MDNLPNDIKQFIKESAWIFAKTYADTWPHEYLVKDKVDKQLFLKFVKHIREHGYIGKFYQKSIVYLDHQDKVYWTMGAPIEDTTIINRCRKEQTYEYRLAHNDLPK